MSIIEEPYGCYHRRMDGIVKPAAARLQDSALTDDISFLMARANALSLAAGNAALAPLGLRARSYSVLELAAGDARPTQRELAEFLRLDPSQVVALVDELQGLGLVARESDPADRRTKVVAATPRGREVCQVARAAATAAEQTLHAGISGSDRELLVDLLRRLAFPA
jgi:DNA-binding MarR family transcriptional regulator